MIAQNLDALRLDAAKRGKWNIGFFAAGLTFWLYATAVGVTLEPGTARVYWLAGTFFIFPAAVVFSRLFGADPFTKGNVLGALVGDTHMSVIVMTLPLVLAAFLYFPEMMLLTMAIAYCVDFYVMTWAFGTRLFGLHAALRTAVVSVIWFGLPEWRASALPASVAVFYLATLIISPILRHRWLAERET